MSDWVVCSCASFGVPPVTACACGKPCNVQIGGWKYTVHMDGKHWNIECAKKEVASRKQ